MFDLHCHNPPKEAPDHAASSLDEHPRCPVSACATDYSRRRKTLDLAIAFTRLLRTSTLLPHVALLE